MVGILIAYKCFLFTQTLATTRFSFTSICKGLNQFRFFITDVYMLDLLL